MLQEICGCARDAWMAQNSRAMVVARRQRSLTTPPWPRTPRSMRSPRTTTSGRMPRQERPAWPQLQLHACVRCVRAMALVHAQGGPLAEPPAARRDCTLQFSEWLRLERGQFFNELSSEETHALFAEFAAAWNARSLPARFYLGIADASLRRTKHAWGIRGAWGCPCAPASQCPCKPGMRPGELTA